MSPESLRVPLSPAEAAELQAEQIPGEVYEVFNSLIARSLHDGYAKVLQKEILEELVKRGMDETEIFARHWLDVEKSYTEAGWWVSYDKPVGWGGEHFEAYFEFSEVPRERSRYVR